MRRYTPGVQERRHDWSRLGEYPASLRAFKSAGYHIWHLVGTSKGGHQVLDEPDWSRVALPALSEVTEATLQAEEVNARNMLVDNSRRGAGFSVPWDLHPKSLHAEFAHNTDLLLTLEPGAVRRSREVGVHADSAFGLGGGLCVHVLRDGTAAEMIGRLCVAEGRNESIARAIATAEAARPLRNRESWHAQVGRESRGWQLTGKSRSPERRMRRVGATAQAQARGGKREALASAAARRRMRDGRRGGGGGRANGRPKARDE